MNTKFLAGALALSLWGGAALAQESGTGGSLSDPTTDETVVVPADDVSVNVQPAPTEPARGWGSEDRWRDMRGMVTLGAGIEGYTGDLRDQINVGFGWGVSAAFKPTSVLGLELGYTGAVNELGDDAFALGGSEANGADLIRNGGHALATLGLGNAPVQPYVLAGVGIDWYNNRATGTQLDDDVAGRIPLGAGIRGHIGRFTADARLHYTVLFSDDFAPNITNGNNPGSYMGQLSIGSNF